ncbi:MAG: hypothetical protein H7308_00970, partial [Chthonomonadaceae bacterium]|nr:hypothetical protein [Chthonomonadaceae bacterium]
MNLRSTVNLNKLRGIRIGTTLKSNAPSTANSAFMSLGRMGGPAMITTIGYVGTIVDATAERAGILRII